MDAVSATAEAISRSAVTVGAALPPYRQWVAAAVTRATNSNTDARLSIQINAYPIVRVPWSRGRGRSEGSAGGPGPTPPPPAGAALVAGPRAPGGPAPV